RISANVSGFLGTERITLNDNLLARASLPEIESVMGHEMGHYVLHHVEKALLEFGLIIVAGFAFAQALFERLRARWQERWKVRGPADPAGLPLMGLLLSTYLFVLTPVLNTVVRTQEQEADLFGLNAAAQPDGFAQVALKLSEYRKLEPGPLEEILFYDHPSGRTRIFTAMRWKAEHPETWTAPAARSSAPAAAVPAAPR
ncbi:MAG TPA: M48 family metalloprotease, partial [Myxococcales bacterium]|nr:M48 family metalloprotease [Myxococcales bacterium]